MGMFDQMKMAADMMKNMSPDQLQTFMKQAEESKRMLEETIRKTLDEEIKKRGLITRAEAEELIRRSRS